MRKITNLLSITLLSSLLACSGQVVGQNVNINNNAKPTVTPNPKVTISPNVIKPSPSTTPTPEPIISPSVTPSSIGTPKPKDYSSIVFSLKENSYLNKTYQETISTAPVFTSLKDEKAYYDEKTLKNPKSSQYYNTSHIFLGEIRKFELELFYLDGTKDQDYTIQIPEEFKAIVGTQDGKLYGLSDGFSYIKVISNKNKNIFKFINIEVGNYGVGTNPVISNRVELIGKVVDTSNIPVYGAKVTAKSIAGIKWSSEYLLSSTNNYYFKDDLWGYKIQITVTKDGWTTRERTEVMNYSLDSKPLVNRFDFSGEYAIQDEPEITSLKVNGKSTTSTGPAIKPVIKDIENSSANLSGLDNNLEVEMTFSEPVKRESVENSFRIVSQNFAIKNNTNIIIDKNTSGITWEWSNNDSTVKFKMNQPVLTNTNGNEPRYMIEFTQPFRDKNNNEAILGKHIRFNTKNSGDFHIFSVKNDETDPKLLSITATDGVNGSNDVIELKFSEPMEVLGRKSDELVLANPLEPSNTAKQTMLHQTNNIGSNNTTVLGYSKVDFSLKKADFRGVFTIARLTQPIVFNQALIPLNITSLTPDNLIDAKNLLVSKITGNNVRLEFPSTAFNKDEIIVLSVGRTILGKYEDLTNGISSFKLDSDLPGITNATVTDPAGRTMSTSNNKTSLNITVNDSQRVTVVQ